MALPLFVIIVNLLNTLQSNRMCLIWLLQQTIFAENETCPYQNMVKNANGECICLPGFVTESDYNGCWKCESNCHSLARCIHPGICTCMNGLYGNGVDACDVPIPMNLSIQKLDKLETGGYSVRLEYSTYMDFKPQSAFCRVGHNILAANNISDKIISCIIPQRIYGNYTLTASFDGYNWGNEQIISLNKTRNNKYLAESLPFVAVLTVIVFIGTALMHGKKLIFEKEAD